MRVDPIPSASAETAYLKQLCENARELRETAQQLRMSSQQLRLLCKATISRARASRSESEALAAPTAGARPLILTP